MSSKHPLFRAFAIEDCNGFRISIGTVGDHLGDLLGPGVAEQVEEMERHCGGSRVWAARETTHSRAKSAWSMNAYAGTTEDYTRSYLKTEKSLVVSSALHPLLNLSLRHP